MFKQNDELTKSRLGLLLLEKQWINEQQLNQALAYQKVQQCRLGESLVALEFITETQLKKALKRQKAVRSLVAGLVLATTPICPVLASEGDDKSRFRAGYEVSISSQPSAILSASPASNVSESSSPLPIFEHTGIKGKAYEFQLLKDPVLPSATPTSLYIPEFSMLAYNGQQQSDSGLLTRKSLKGKQRYDRYKNTVPATYRLTVKGFSLFENQDDKSRFFSFDKAKGSPYKKYELMFSVTKHFN